MTENLHDQILTTADALTEPHTHREPYTIWTGSRHRKTHHHITTQHGLLRRLYHAAIVPTCTNTDEPTSSIPGSRPPLEVEALSRHDQISAAARSWCAHTGVGPRASTESNIRAIVSNLAKLDDQQQKTLLADLRRWSGWCRVYLGLEHIRRIPGVRCPLADCNQLGTLRINLTTSHGLCTTCGATWNTDTIGVLAEHIKINRTDERLSA